MEGFFKTIAWSCATLVLIILLATLIVLYHNATPAIEAFGLSFLTDNRWGVSEPVTANIPIPKKSTPTLPYGSNQENITDKITADMLTNKPMYESDNHNNDIDKEADILEVDEEIDSADTEITTVVDTQSMGNTDPLDDDLGGDFGNDMEEDIPMDNEEEGDIGDQAAGDTPQRVVYGAAVMVVGTILSTLIALLFAIPIAMGIAVFLAEIVPQKLAVPIGVAIELLAAIPSIIYGMWALFDFGPFIANLFGGHSVSLLVAGLVLGVMIIPFMAALSRDAINTTPDILKESAYAMGATKFEVIKDVIFPYAKTGIIGSIIVSLGRAMGETMAVAFVIGGVFKYAQNLTQPTNSIPVVLANNFAESSGLSMSALFYLALILFVISFVIIFAARFFLLRPRQV